MSYRGSASYNRAPNCASRNTRPYTVSLSVLPELISFPIRYSTAFFKSEVISFRYLDLCPVIIIEDFIYGATYYHYAL